MSVALPVLPGSDMLTHSRMACFRRCPREHYYKYELGCRPDRDTTPLRLGSAFHIGLDRLAKGDAIEQAIETATDGYAEVPLWAQRDPDKLLQWMGEREKVAALLECYHEYWGDDDCEIIESEIAFDLPLVNPSTGASSRTFRLGGKIDKIIKLRDGRIAIREHKTTGEDISRDSHYWRKLGIDQQVSNYYIAAWRMGHKIETVDYDVARRPEHRVSKSIPLRDDDGFKIVLDENGERVFKGDGTPRQTGGQGMEVQTRSETAGEFRERVIADIKSRPEHYFARREITRLQADIEEFEHELWDQAQAIRQSQLNGRWYRNTAQCVTYSPCAYLSVCRCGIDPANGIPDGFTRVEHLHPELTEGDSE